MELGYWAIKGRCEPIRWLALYLGLDIKWVNIELKNAGEWFGKRKAELELDFPNLPYLIDGDFKITESAAIAQYLIHKAGRSDLLGKDLREQAKARELEGVISDIKQQVFKSIYLNSEDSKIKESFALSLREGELIPSKLAQLSKVLGGKEFLQDHLTYQDFEFAYWCELLEVVAASLGSPNPLLPHKNLMALVQRVKSLPKVAERVNQSDDLMYSPLMKFRCLTYKEYHANVLTKK